MTFSSGMSTSLNTRFVSHSRYDLQDSKDPDQVRAKLSECLQVKPENITVDIEAQMSIVRGQV